MKKINVLIAVDCGRIDQVFLIKNNKKADHKYQELLEEYNIYIDPETGRPHTDNENDVYYYEREVIK